MLGVYTWDLCLKFLSPLQGSSSGENLNYTSLIFSGGGCGPSSTKDYKKMKAGQDYINVDPQNSEVNFWSCSSNVVSQSVEYTQVKL